MQLNKYSFKLRYSLPALFVQWGRNEGRKEGKEGRKGGRKGEGIKKRMEANTQADR